MRLFTWRKHYAPKIHAIIHQNEGKPKKEIKRMLVEANPGEYGHQKKIWSDESLKQLGLKKKKKKIEDNQKELW